MKLTKSKLNQLIREALTESWDVGPPPDQSAPGWHPNDTQEWERSARAAERREEEEEDDEATLPLPLDSDEYDVATAALQYAMHYHPYPEEQLHSPPWAKAVYHVIDSQFGEEEWSPTPGGRHPIEISEPSLKTLNWALNIRELPGWLEDNEYIDDGAMAALPVVKEKVQALLAGEEKQPEPEEKQPEPETPAPEDERIDPRFAHLDLPSPESMEARALKRWERGQDTMKLTKNTLEQLIREELEVLSADAQYVKDINFTPDETGEMKVSNAHGQDSWMRIRDTEDGAVPGAFEKWKAIILELDVAFSKLGEEERAVVEKRAGKEIDPNSSAILERGRWEPAGGIWKEKAAAWRRSKGATLARWGSSH